MVTIVGAALAMALDRCDSSPSRRDYSDGSRRCRADMNGARCEREVRGWQYKSFREQVEILRKRFSAELKGPDRMYGTERRAANVCSQRRAWLEARYCAGDVGGERGNRASGLGGR